MTRQSYRFIMQAGPNPGKAFYIQKPETTIGRDEQSDIFILESGVSRNHAVLSLQGPNYVLKDLGSTNGTFVNEQRLISTRSLRSGDVVMLGDRVKLVFDETQYDPEATLQRAKVATETYEPTPGGAPSYQPSLPPAAIPLPPRPVTPPQAPQSFNFEPDKYEADKDRQRKVMPWVLGVAGVILLCCVVVIAAFVLIDVTNSWCSGPQRALADLVAGILYGTSCPP